MKKVETYLFFNGNCREAMQFYERALNGTLNLVETSDTPNPTEFGPGNEDKIVHSRLEADSATLMASDWLATTPYPGMAGFSVTLSVPTAAEAKGLFDKLVDGGKATMPFGKTFYSDGFGMLIDRFGTPWMVMAEEKT
jgi:PhnB protein